MTPDCTIIVRSPAELIAVIPYLLGFHPTHSIVVIGVDGPLVTFGARHDLSPPDDQDITDLAAVIASQPARAVVLVGYGPAASVTPMIQRLSHALAAAAVPICDSLRITEGRWWSYLCADPQCCPVEGQLCPPPGNPIAAAAVYQGQVALPDRQALVAQVAAVTGEERLAMAAATARARDQLSGYRAKDQPLVEITGRRVSRAGRAAVRSAERRHRAGKRLSDDEVAALGLLLADDSVHDYALNRSEFQEWRIGLWTEVLRRVEPAYVGPPACLLAFTAWQGGRGALARVAMDRALAEGAAHRTVLLLDRLLRCGISPDAVAALQPPPVEVPDLGGGGGGGATDPALRATDPALRATVSGGRTGGERRFDRSTRRRSS
ncbi:MAG TPA: DUF4192 domain-containing protein [Actinoplanes sp.]